MELRERIEARTDVWRKRADQLTRDTYHHGMVVGKLTAAELILGWLDEADAPPEELPEGVHRAPDGTLLALPENLPVGWQIYYQHNPGGWRWSDADEFRVDGVFRHVRPVPPEPETERVPWYEAKGRTLNGDVVIEVKQTNVHPNGAVWTRSEGWLLADADGMVSVLKETGR